MVDDDPHGLHPLRSVEDEWIRISRAGPAARVNPADTLARDVCYYQFCPFLCVLSASLYVTSSDRHLCSSEQCFDLKFGAIRGLARGRDYLGFFVQVRAYVRWLVTKLVTVGPSLVSVDQPWPLRG
jgi:hypothetical protein